MRIKASSKIIIGIAIFLSFLSIGTTTLAYRETEQPAPPIRLS